MYAKSILRIIVIVGAILLLPFLATQLTDEVMWDMGDFIVMGTLLLVTGVLLECIVKKLPNPYYRITGIVLVTIVFLLIWAELGVGIFGTPWAGS